MAEETLYERAERISGEIGYAFMRMRLIETLYERGLLGEILDEIEKGV